VTEVFLERPSQYLGTKEADFRGKVRLTMEEISYWKCLLTS